MNSCRRRMLCCCNPWLFVHFCPTFVQLLYNVCFSTIEPTVEWLFSNFCPTFVPLLSNFCLAGLNFVPLLFYFFSTFIQRVTDCAFCLNIYKRLFLGVNYCSKSNLIKSLYDVNTLWIWNFLELENYWSFTVIQVRSEMILIEQVETNPNKLEQALTSWNKSNQVE